MYSGQSDCCIIHYISSMEEDNYDLLYLTTNVGIRMKIKKK